MCQGLNRAVWSTRQCGFDRPSRVVETSTRGVKYALRLVLTATLRGRTDERPTDTIEKSSGVYLNVALYPSVNNRSVSLARSQLSMI
jgi:hypothetical protein